MKICLLGEGAVGKTSIRQRFLGHGFDSSYLITLGADFAVKTIETPEQTYRFQIWDLAGQPSFTSIRDLYYKGSLGALIVFDLTRPETLPALESWVNGLYRHSSAAPLILLGNKADIATDSENTTNSEDIDEFLEHLKEKRGMDVPYFETSAVTGQNIDKAFSLLGETIFKEESWEASKSHRWAQIRAQKRNNRS